MMRVLCVCVGLKETCLTWYISSFFLLPSVPCSLFLPPSFFLQVHRSNGEWRIQHHSGQCGARGSEGGRRTSPRGARIRGGQRRQREQEREQEPSRRRIGFNGFGNGAGRHITGRAGAFGSAAGDMGSASSLGLHLLRVHAGVNI